MNFFPQARLHLESASEKVGMEKYGVDFGMGKASLSKSFSLVMRHLGQERQKFTGITDLTVITPRPLNTRLQF